ncbi:MAG: sulfite exporter TauE/SafE family protein [Candidatus Peregrinibacteria bacterium]|nr:sulfite exporter TauE/SafE family protein [Candidatus Peregrinibacteria bacterium]
MDRTIIPIRNMHCKSCELLIERALLRIPGIKSANVNFHRSEAVIHSHGTLDLERVRQAVEEAGYEVGESEKRLWLTRDSNEYGYLAIGGLLLLALYILASRSGLLQLSMASAAGTDIVSAILIGLTAGISTCMALVGGLVLGVSARHAEKHPEASVLQKFRPHIFFNVGRIGAFFILGGLLGTLGGFLSPSAGVLGILTMLVAAVMLLLGMQLTEIFPRLNSYKLTLPSALSRALGISQHHTKEYSHRSAMTLGALTFFLPCGFTQLMQMNAIASGGFLPGGIIMAAFAIGTAPGLLGIGGLTSIVHGLGAKIFFKTAGLLVVAFAIFNLTNGYRMTGWEPFWEMQGNRVPTQTTSTVEEGVQIVRMLQTARGYEPNAFVVKRGVPVRWIVNATDPNSCAASINFPAFSLSKYLSPGENIIEFTPLQTGTLRFSCSMGMYPGSFTVID